MRIATWNTQGSRGIDGVWSTPRIASALRPLGADAICLQELHQRTVARGGEDQPARIAELLGRHITFQPNVTYLIGAYGVGILLREAPLEVRMHALPGRGEPRGALEVRIGAGFGRRRLILFCTHWGLTGAARREQGNALAAIVQQTSGPVVLCGDFNEEPDAPGVASLIERCELQDVGGAALTWPSDQPAARIDLVLISKGLRAGPPELFGGRASDHLGVCVDVSRETADAAGRL
ncbi:MAG: endonuclease/exonuclease/phosphatase family protein [Armatimonadetes bacterium]|nr:endonuclease/exonuclease/phosphatase family protein [Armatimonadota bacterium]MDE2206100.1 endonuclease/exonuclease/phosphatase family protein [Armatimonadota bacterium]